MSDQRVINTIHLNQSFMVGEWRVDPAIELISRGELEEKVEPRVMELLVYMANQPGEVLSREELESEVWKGMVVGYDALSSAIIKLRKAFHDDSRNPKIIQTVSKRGYRLIAGVIPVEGLTRDSSTGSIPTEKQFKTRSQPVLWVAVLSVAIAGLVVALTSWNGSVNQDGAATEEIPIILVLPFHNTSDEPEQVSFADGITDDIITDLSRIANLQVLARNTSYR